MIDVDTVSAAVVTVCVTKSAAPVLEVATATYTVRRDGDNGNNGNTHMKSRFADVDCTHGPSACV
jgi:hypothetical protein